MRLKTSRPHAEERLVAVLNLGYNILNEIQEDLLLNKKTTHQHRLSRLVKWLSEVSETLHSIFPTKLEWNQFQNTPKSRGVRVVGPETDTDYLDLKEYFEDLIGTLLRILQKDLPRYTDLPQKERLYVEDIDSFYKVRDVNPAIVLDLLNNGRWEISEDQVQMCLEQILNVSFHKKDWGGEYNDLYTANLVLNGARTASAFLLKGNGLKKKAMEIADCGKNGDQIVKLFESPAKLFIIQFIGNISESVIKDIADKVKGKRAAGQEACYCIIDGQDTARLFRAYGKA